MFKLKVPWHRLIRAGVPAMFVIRRPLRVGEKTLEIGEEYPAPQGKRAQNRCRQYYEARRIAPIPQAGGKEGSEKKDPEDERDRSSGQATANDGQASNSQIDWQIVLASQAADVGVMPAAQTTAATETNKGKKNNGHRKA